MPLELSKEARRHNAQTGRCRHLCFVGWALAAVLVGSSAVAAPALPKAADPPAQWLVTGAMHELRIGHSATLLSDGRVLACGGQASQVGGPFAPLASCEIWDPTDETWRPAGSLSEPRTQLAAIPLDRDRVALIGGSQAPGQATAAQTSIDIWDRKSEKAVSVGRLPFPAARPQAVRLPDGRIFVLNDEDGVAKPPQAAIWDPSSRRSILDEAPRDVGQTAALLVDREGSLTSIRRGPACQEVAIWRRPPGQTWALAHVERVSGCVAGAMLVEGGRIAFWLHQTSPGALIWDPATGVTQQLMVPNPQDHQQLVALDSGRWLAVGWGNSHLYEPQRGWRPTGGSGAGDRASFTRLQDGRVLVVSSYESRVWTPSTHVHGEACVSLTARLTSYLQEGPRFAPRPTREGVTSACVRALSADPDGEASRALRRLTDRPLDDGGRDGLGVICDLRPSWAVGLMARGLDTNVLYEGGGACLGALAETDDPVARQHVEAAVQAFVRGDRASYVLVEAARSSENLRVRAADVLVVFWREKRPGFDQLKEVVCRTPVPPGAAEICKGALPYQENEWKEQPKRRHAWKMTGAVTVIGAGLAVGGLLARNGDAGRATAVAAGGLGASALMFPSLADVHPGPIGAVGEAFESGFSVVLGVVGAVGAGLATSSSGDARAIISVTGGLLFTALSLTALWHF